MKISKVFAIYIVIIVIFVSFLQRLAEIDASAGNGVKRLGHH